MYRKTRDNLKWSLIVIGFIITMTGAFTGTVVCFIPLGLMFWLYIILDKFKNVTKKASLGKLYKDEEH